MNGFHFHLLSLDRQNMGSQDFEKKSQDSSFSTPIVQRKKVFKNVNRKGSNELDLEVRCMVQSDRKTTTDKPRAEK